MTTPIKDIPVKDEDLHKVMEATKQLPNTKVRRFIVEGHNGKEYWHNEFDEVILPDNPKPLEDYQIVKHLRETCLKEGYQIYSITEVNGNHTVEELGKLPPHEVANIMRPLYYDFFDEPLESFRDTL